MPITGFANSVVSSAIEYKSEGQVFGIGCKIFTKGNIFTGYARNNTNESWKLIGSAEIPMGQEVLIGFAVDGRRTGLWNWL